MCASEKHRHAILLESLGHKKGPSEDGPSKTGDPPLKTGPFCIRILVNAGQGCQPPP